MENEENIQQNIQQSNQGAGTAAAPVKYDKRARQQSILAGENKENRYRLTFAVNGLADEDLFEFDALQEIQIIKDGKDQRLITNTMPAARWFFNNRVELLDGFDGDSLPDNWQDDFSDEEKQAVVDAFLDVDVAVTEETKTLGKRKFGVSKVGDVIVIKAVFSGQETLCSFTFPPKEKKHGNKFRSITTGSKFKKGRQGRFMPETWRELCKLYDEMGVACGDANPAVHIKVLAMREHFEAELEKEAKK